MLVIWLILLLFAPVLAQDDLGMIRLPGGAVERVEVPGGPIVLLQPIPDLPCAAVCLLVPAGSRSDPVGKAGMAHLTEHFMFRATPGFPGGLLPALYEEIGARRGAATTEDSLLFWATVPSRQLDLALKVEADRLAGLEFSQSDFDRECELVAAELSRTSPAQLQAQEVRHSLWPFDPARSVPVAGRAEAIEALQPADVRRFYSEHVRRDQAVLVVVGGFSRPKVRQHLWRIFPRSSDGAPPLPPAAPIAPQPGLRDRAGEAGGAAPAVVATYSLEGARSGELAALQVVCAALGCQFLLDPATSTLQIKLSLDSSGSPARALELLKTRLARVREVALEPAALEAAKARARASFFEAWEDPARRARDLAVAEAWGHLDWYVELPGRIAALRAEPLREAAQRWLAPERAAVVYLEGTPGAGPAAAELAEARADEDLASPGLPSFARIKLDNQLVILVQKVKDLPTVAIRGYVLGGEQLDPPDRRGLTDLAARVLGERDEPGLKLRFTPQLQTLEVEGWCPTDQLPRWTELLAEALVKPRVDPEQLARELQEPGDPAYRAFLAKAYPADHPYARSESLRQATVEEVQDHLTRTLRPDRMVLAVSGDVEPSQVERLMRARLDSWKVEPAPPPIPVPAAPTPAPARVELTGPGPLATVLVGHPGPGRNESDYYAFNLLNQVLGGNPVTSRLAVRLRDLERLGPRVESRLLPASGSSPWAVVAQVEPDKVDRAVAVITDELRKATLYAPTEEELVRARTSLEGRLQVAQGAGTARAAMLASVELYRLTESYPRDFSGLYGRIGAKDLLATAKARLHPDNLVVVVVRPVGGKQ